MSDSESDDYPTCEVLSCNEEMEGYSPCCHVPLCEEHRALIEYCCSSEDCPQAEEMCQVCLDINGYWSCQSCGKYFCSECSPEHKC